MSIELTLIVVICILVIFLVPLFHNINIMKSIIQSGTHIELNNIPFRTGDMIFFRWNHSIGEFDKNNTFITNKGVDTVDTLVSLIDCYIKDITFIHPGIIVIYNNIPYILELKVTPVYCNYSKKMISHNPSLTCLSSILDYNGVAVHFPYKGDTIPNSTINEILSKKGNYLHARHDDADPLGNIKSYIDYSALTCDDIDLTGLTMCPKYINCYQYIIIVLKKCKILDSNIILNMYPKDFLNAISNTKIYGPFQVIINKYLLQYYK